MFHKVEWSKGKSCCCDTWLIRVHLPVFKYIIEEHQASDRNEIYNGSDDTAVSC